MYLHQIVHSKEYRKKQPQKKKSKNRLQRIVQLIQQVHI